MNKKIKAGLEDILRSIDEIFEFLPKQKNFLYYRENLIIKKAVERNLEIIGEAVGRILKEDDTFPLKNAKRIIDTRNRIIHGYEKISDEMIWTIVTRELPYLRGEVKSLLKE
ncbi:MAG: antitoxin [Bacteroidetes bacterium SW_11_45_7]|nr:MAG: antitoxin [Bacteroidetes bacterium SW_11_45_7]